VAELSRRVDRRNNPTDGIRGNDIGLTQNNIQDKMDSLGRVERKSAATKKELTSTLKKNVISAPRHTGSTLRTKNTHITYNKKPARYPKYNARKKSYVFATRAPSARVANLGAVDRNQRPKPTPAFNTPNKNVLLSYTTYVTYPKEMVNGRVMDDCGEIDQRYCHLYAAHKQ